MPMTKIICTLGPASGKRGVILKMMRAGMDVVRLNFSHGSFAEHLQRIKIVRELNQKYRRRIRILGDLEGYRIRIGRLKAGKPVELRKGAVVWLTVRNVTGEGNVIPFDYRGPLEKIKKGRQIFIDDGNIALVVEGRRSDAIKARVLVPGLLKEHKGINMPDVRFNFHGVLLRDRVAIEFCLKHKVDLLAQSFVRTAEDILAVRKLFKGYRHQPDMVAKIENSDGIQNIDDIIDVSDGIMIARGDMGVSLPVYSVPMIQKEIIRKCNHARKVAITATQMLESMTEHQRPTRAEVSDVANAILDGTDYVMLSAETAAGAYPVQAVDMMNRIIVFTEKHLPGAGVCSGL
jgi:pyruvate kinase